MMKGKVFFSSWSGGKDSALAFYEAVQSGGEPGLLLTMFEEGGLNSKSHALPYDVIAAQAEKLNVPLLTKNASWTSYEGMFREALNEMKHLGITYGVFGDIDLIDHLNWVQNICEKAGVTAIHPLWEWPRKNVLKDVIELGFEAYIIVVDSTRLSPSYLGRKLTHELVEELNRLGVDPCGESGEFHTLVVDGPIFSSAVPVRFREIVENEGYAFLTMELLR
ncbi:diphthine--ammonia ligase [Chungangia koreensis]|uniref:Diphthine--ammonia ligase n=1 Tax=Chungangia koreensis TaxID=752657 RepID=A0ABV8X666_9LACT